MARKTKSDQAPRKGALGRALKLFLTMFVILLVPIVLDQVEVDEETVRIVGRVAAAVVFVLFLYGIFTKLLKVLGIVIAVLTVLAVLVSEDVIEAPRLSQLLSGEAEDR